MIVPQERRAPCKLNNATKKKAPDEMLSVQSDESIGSQ